MQEIDKDETAGLARRGFLQRIAAVGLTTIAPGTFLYSLGKAANRATPQFPGKRRADQPVNGARISRLTAVSAGAC